MEEKVIVGFKECVWEISSLKGGYPVSLRGCVYLVFTRNDIGGAEILICFTVYSISFESPKKQPQKVLKQKNKKPTFSGQRIEALRWSSLVSVSVRALQAAVPYGWQSLLAQQLWMKQKVTEPQNVHPPCTVPHPRWWFGTSSHCEQVCLCGLHSGL